MEIYNRPRELKKTTGTGMVEVLKAGLGLYEVKIRAGGVIRQEAYNEGYDKGINEDWDLLAVKYPCSICGKEIEVDTEAEKK